MPNNGVVAAAKVDAPSYGLFSVADVQNHSARDSHWIDGFFVETAVCSSKAEAITICAPTEDWNTIFDNTGASPFFHVTAFTILETYECENSIGINAIDRRKTVREQLEAITEYAVEQELWLGTSAQLDDNPIPAERWLVGATDATPTPGTGVKPKLALALVEQAFAEANPGIQATIHVTPLIAAILGDGVFTDEDGVLYTTQGSKVAISRGGDADVGPASGGDETTHWIYATGPVHVDLGTDELITSSMSEIVDARTNTVKYVAERPAAVYFDGCAWFGVLADATL